MEKSMHSRESQTEARNYDADSTSLGAFACKEDCKGICTYCMKCAQLRDVHKLRVRMIKVEHLLWCSEANIDVCQRCSAVYKHPDMCEEPRDFAVELYN
eukprot:772327-Pelagomonas_calceolata.AAC.2